MKVKSKINSWWKRLAYWKRGGIGGFLVGLISYLFFYTKWLISLYPNQYICLFPSKQRCEFINFFPGNMSLFIKSLIIVLILLTILGIFFNPLYNWLKRKIQKKNFLIGVIIKGLILGFLAVVIFTVFSKGLDYIARGEIKCWVWENSYSCSLMDYITLDSLYFIVFLIVGGGIIIFPVSIFVVLLYEIIRKKVIAYNLYKRKKKK